MADAGKRKTAPAGGGGQPTRKKKAGTKGKWQTPHQKAKLAQAQSGQVQAGDVGLWATCARGQESRAARELAVLLGEYGESMYGVKREDGEGAGKEQEGRGDEEEKEGVEKEQEDEDIESAIRREVAALKARERDGDLGHHQSPSGSASSSSALPLPLFKVIRVGNLDCLMFARARVPPVDPVALVRRVCADARVCADPRRRRSRYLNRLSPVSASGKATEQGLAEVAARALGAVFVMRGTPAVQDGGEGQKKEEGKEEEGEKTGTKEGNADDGVRESESGEARTGVTEESGTDTKGAVGTGPDAKAPVIVPPAEQKPYTFAIRPTIRNHSALKRDAVVKQVASLIDEQRHKVNLGSPDKVILVEIFQATCGISVVDGSDWEVLKKFNLSELYSPSRPKQPGEGGVAARVDAGVAKESKSIAAEEQQAGGGVEGREGEGEGKVGGSAEEGAGENCNPPL